MNESRVLWKKGGVAMPALKTSLVRIGNSHGIRIPKAVIQQIRLIDEVEIEVKRDCLVIKPADNPRAGWVEAFQAASCSDDSVLDEWEGQGLADDKDGWKWK